MGGNRDPEKNHGFATLTTSVIEGLNVLDVVTADRIVAQVNTEHPLDGYVPHNSFLGTRFENLRIAGCLVEVKLKLDILGARSEDDSPYTQNTELQGRIKSQFDNLGEHKSWLGEMRERFDWFLPAKVNGEQKRESLECSLVSSVSQNCPGEYRGNVIRIPNFGTIVLARVALTDHEIQARRRDGVRDHCPPVDDRLQAGLPSSRKSDGCGRRQQRMARHHPHSRSCSIVHTEGRF